MSSYDLAKQIIEEMDQLKESLSNELTDNTLREPMVNDLVQAQQTVQTIKKTLFLLNAGKE